MARIPTLLISVLILLIILPGCKTLYKTGTVDIEVMIPAKVRLPHKYNRIAIKYNNSNVSFNPYFAVYNDGIQNLNDTVNMDSLASEVYFNMFVETLKNNIAFESVSILNPTYYENYSFIDNSSMSEIRPELLAKKDVSVSEIAISSLKSLIDKYIPKSRNNIKIIDPEYGLYSKQELEQIANSTDANLFLSLDFFAGFDGISFKNSMKIGYETVINITFWNIYDLEKKELIYFYNKIDTIYWDTGMAYQPGVYNIKNAKKMLPERNDAILNAADISGTNFGELIVPHWLEVQRMFYRSNHIELRKTEDLIKKNEWLEAAKIWKNNVNNKNKSIAAKSMFNLALACEIEGDLDAAIDWAVKSFHVFGSKNELHYFNCVDYLKILGQRKLDIKTIDLQLSPENVNSELNKNK